MTRGRHRVGSALLAGGALVPLTIAGLSAPAAATIRPAPLGSGSPTTATTAVPSSPVEVTLTALTPVAPQPHDTLTVRGTLRNVSTTSIGDLTVQLRLGGAVGSRSEFDSYAADPTETLPVMTPIGTAQPAARPTLRPDASESFRITVPVDDFGLLDDVWQVHELGIVATGTTTTGTTTVGQLRTFLPWAPRDAIGVGVPTQVAWIWPLVDRPHRTASPVWADDDLAPQLGNGGRLTRLVTAGTTAETQAPHSKHGHLAAVPVTWAIDPMLIEDAQLMTKGYQVRNDAGRTVAGTGVQSAKAWLGAVHTAVDGRSILPLPYGDPDVVAATRAGLTTELGVAATSGRSLLQQVFATSSLLAMAWPPGGLLDERTVDALFATGVTAFVLADTALPVVGGEPSETPSAQTVFDTNDGSLTADLSDQTLTDVIDAGATDPASSRVALQRYLAETLMIQAEEPSDQRSIVVAPERRWDPTASYADALLADTGKVPWITPVSLKKVSEGPVYTKVQRSPLTYLASARQAQLPPSYMHKVVAAQHAVDTFATILPAGSALIQGFESAIDRSLSSGWQADPTGRGNQLSSLRSQIDSSMRSVRIASQPGSFVTLTSHNGNVPVTIANDLNSPVHVRLRLDANQRLTLGENASQVYPVPAHQQINIDVHAAAKTSGVFPLQVRLLTPKGQRYGAAVQLNVRSTVYGTVTLVITGAAMAALLLAVGIRLTRRALRARQPTTPTEAG